MRSIKRFDPSNDVNWFIIDLNKTYTIQVKLEIATHQTMENEFVKFDKLYSNKWKNQENTSSYDQLISSLLMAVKGWIFNILAMYGISNDKLIKKWWTFQANLKISWETAVHIKFKVNNRNSKLTLNTVLFMKNTVLISKSMIDTIQPVV